MGGFELTATLCTVCMLGLAMAVMDGRGESDLTRWVPAELLAWAGLERSTAVLAGPWRHCPPPARRCDLSPVGLGS